MESKQKGMISLTVVFGVVGVGLLVAAFATDNWVKASPHRKTDETDNATSSNDGPGVNTGTSSFGLFNGKQALKYQTGSRDFDLKAVCDASEGVCAYIFMRTEFIASDKLKALIQSYKNRNSTASEQYSQIQHGLFSFPLWVSTLLALSLSIVVGLVTIGFSIFNVFGRPIETITGPMGLYLWNAVSLLLTVLTLILFGVLFQLQLSENFMTLDDYRIGWRSKGYTSLDFSYLLMVGAAAAFILNFILLFLSGQSFSCSYPGSGEKEVDNGMILY